MTKVRVFIGSSSEGRPVAEAFQSLIVDASEPTVWDQGIFGVGEYTMEGLEREAAKADFAVLIITPDDTLETRSQVLPAPRGNVLLELGLFMGAIGVKRVLMLAPNSPKMALPSDLDGLTRLQSYDAGRSDGNLAAALGPAARQAKMVFRERGPRVAAPAASAGSAAPDHATRLAHELELIGVALEAQGWRTIRPNATTTLRVVSPKGKRFSMKIAEDPAATRQALRDFARDLRAHGLRVNDRVREPV